MTLDGTIPDDAVPAPSASTRDAGGALDAGQLKFILGIKLRNLRQAKRLSLKELARRAGLSISYLSEIEKGKKYPKPEKLLKLSRALGVTFDELVSLKVQEELGPLRDVFSSDFVREFPFELFGLQAENFLSLVRRRPTRRGRWCARCSRSEKPMTSRWSISSWRLCAPTSR